MVWRRRAPEKILNDFIDRQSFVDQRWAGPTGLALGDWICIQPNHGLKRSAPEVDGSRETRLPVQGGDTDWAKRTGVSALERTTLW